MIDTLRKNLNIILERNIDPQHFLSCTEAQWQAFIQRFSSSNTLSHLLTLDWWRFVWDHFPTGRVLLISTDVILYTVALLLIVQFGLLYSSSSAHYLLNLSGDFSRRLVGLAFVLFCAQVYYFWSTNVPADLNWAEGYSYMHSLYQVDYFTQLAKFFMFMLWLGLYRFLDSLAVSHSQGIAEFPILSHLVLCLSLTLISAGDFALLLICLEGFSLILYIMATIGRLHGGVSAAVKYFAFGTAGSVLILWGAIHFYEATSSMLFRSLFYAMDYLSENTYTDGALLAKLEWAAAAVLIGLLVKLGAAPTHQWVPDVYAGVPMFITAFYSIFVKFVLYVLFLRLAYHLSSNQELEYAAAISLVVGCFGTLRQVEIKRFLAYGSITHIGFLLTGDLSASIVYLASYMLASFVFFSVLLSLRVNGQEFTYLSDLRFIAASGSHWDRLLLVFALASMAGLPPFAGFYGKMLIWSSLIEDIYLFNDLTSYALLLVNLAVSLIVIFYYMRLIVIVYLGGGENVRVVPYLLGFWQASKNNDWTVYRHDVVANTQGSGGYVYARTIDARGIQYVLAFFLAFWTLVMPVMLTLTTAVSETLALTWTY